VLIPLGEFRSALARHAGRLEDLGGISLEDTEGDIHTAVNEIDVLVTDLGVVENMARIVAGTKTLHRLLPGLGTSAHRRPRSARTVDDRPEIGLHPCCLLGSRPSGVEGAYAVVNERWIGLQGG